MKLVNDKQGLKKEILMELRGFVDKYSLSGELDKVCKYITSLPKEAIERYPLNKELKKSHRFSIRHDTESDYGEEGYHDVYHLQYYRWETDDELSKRIELNKKQIAASKEREKNKKEGLLKREKTLYENLKKKFEGQ